MTTRWFVEVSPVDADTLRERYCVDAPQWQQALQNARRLRGDSGPLARFMIELLDNGYRAVDPTSRLRYLVSRAPEDAELAKPDTDVQPAATKESNGKRPRAATAPRAKVSVIPRPKNHSAPPRPATSQASLAPKEPPRAPPQPRTNAEQPDAAAGPSSPRAVLQVAEAPAGVRSPTAEPLAPPAAEPLAVPAAEPLAPPAAEPPAVPTAELLAPPTAEPTAAPMPSAEESAHGSEPVPLGEPAAEPSDAPVSSVEPIALVAASQELRPEAQAGAPSLPDCELLLERREEPTEEVPITYREYAYAVAPNTPNHELRDKLDRLFEQVRDSIAQRPPGKFVQIALFDRRFEGKPDSPPLAVLAWKDWRGGPSIQIEIPDEDAQPPAQDSAEERPEASFPEPSAPPPARAQPPVESRPETRPEGAPPHAPAPADQPPVQAIGVTPPVFVGAPASPQRPPQQETITERPRRARGEDLIGELFDQMHALHFMPDLVAGAEYVLRALSSTLPTEAAMIHVFDINTREFVVVRASGPNGNGALMVRTPDSEGLFREAFRRTRTLHVRDAKADERFGAQRYQELGVVATSALCGPVQQGGRYLGVIELLNPSTPEAFYDSEINALDYICAQFADFVANRPLVLDHDVILPRS